MGTFREGTQHLGKFREGTKRLGSYREGAKHLGTFIYRKFRLGTFSVWTFCAMRRGINTDWNTVLYYTPSVPVCIMLLIFRFCKINICLRQFSKYFYPDQLSLNCSSVIMLNIESDQT